MVCNLLRGNSDADPNQAHSSLDGVEDKDQNWTFLVNSVPCRKTLGEFRLQLTWLLSLMQPPQLGLAFQEKNDVSRYRCGTRWNDATTLVEFWEKHPMIPCWWIAFSWSKLSTTFGSHFGIILCWTGYNFLELQVLYRWNTFADLFRNRLCTAWPKQAIVGWW